MTKASIFLLLLFHCSYSSAQIGTSSKVPESVEIGKIKYGWREGGVELGYYPELTRGDKPWYYLRFDDTRYGDISESLSFHASDDEINYLYNTLLEVINQGEDIFLPVGRKTWGIAKFGDGVLVIVYEGTLDIGHFQIAKDQLPILFDK